MRQKKTGQILSNTCGKGRGGVLPRQGLSLPKIGIKAGFLVGGRAENGTEGLVRAPRRGIFTGIPREEGGTGSTILQKEGGLEGERSREDISGRHQLTPLTCAPLLRRVHGGRRGRSPAAADGGRSARHATPARSHLLIRRPFTENACTSTSPTKIIVVFEKRGSAPRHNSPVRSCVGGVRWVPWPQRNP